MDFWAFWFDLFWHCFLIAWFDLIWRLFKITWFDLIWRPFSHDLIWFEFGKSLSIHFSIQNVASGKTNGTDGKSSLRAFDRCHICLWNLNFDLCMAWFWLDPKFWFENGIKSWFDLIWFGGVFSPKIMIWFDLAPRKKVRDLIWFDLTWNRFCVDLIWFEFAHPWL